MKKASEYRQHARDCLELSRRMRGRQREQLLEMASTWEALAKDRESRVSGRPEPGAGQQIADGPRARRPLAPKEEI